MVPSRIPDACGISYGSGIPVLYISRRPRGRNKGRLSFLGEQRARASAIWLRG